MDLIDRIVKFGRKPSHTKIQELSGLMEGPQLTVPALASANNRSANRHLELIEGQMQTIRGAVENPESMDSDVLKSYPDKTTTLERYYKGSK